MLGVLLPPLCVVCEASLGASEGWLCAKCAGSLAATAGRRQRSVPLGRREFRVHYAFDYTSAVARLVQEMKYSDKPGLACLLARAAWPALASELAGPVAFVPVPLHPARRRERGYNQSELLGRALARLAGSPFCARALVRTRNTAAQATLDRQTRLRNVAGSFRARNLSGIGSRRVIVVDDVVTTGSTLGECARALYDCGLEEVEACTVASREG
jgi:ComF family protein